MSALADRPPKTERTGLDSARLEHGPGPGLALHGRGHALLCSRGHAPRERPRPARPPRPRPPRPPRPPARSRALVASSTAMSDGGCEWQGGAVSGVGGRCTCRSNSSRLVIP
eukprot:scaffold22337_cov55-Phaeocystis_antarctica.AAC.3